jgi:hypothetical protein
MQLLQSGNPYLNPQPQPGNQLASLSEYQRRTETQQLLLLFFCSNKRLKKKKKKSQEFDHIFILPTYQFLLVPQQVSSCCSHEAAEHGVSSPPHPAVNAKVAPRQKPFYIHSFYSMQPPPTKISPKNPHTPEQQSKLPFFTTILSQKQFQHLHKHTEQMTQRLVLESS